MADIFDELEVATPQGDIFDEVAVATPAQPAPASLTPAVDAVARVPFGERLMNAIGGAVQSVLPSSFISAMGETGDMAGVGAPPIGAAGSAERAAYNRGGVEAIQDVGPMLAGSVVGGPAIGGPLVRAGLQGLVSSAVTEGVKAPARFAAGESPGSIALDAALPIAAGAAAGPVLVGGAKLLGAAGSAVTGGVKKGIAQLYRPIELAPEQLQALRARELIQTETGQAIPLGIYDVLNSKTIWNQFAGASEITPEALDVVERAAMHVAANTSKSGRTVEEVSKAVFEILDQQKQGLSAPVKTAAEEFTRKAIGAVNKAEAQIGGEARSIFGGRSFGQIGTESKDLAVKALDSSEEAWAAPFEQARALPVYKDIKVDLSGAVQKGKELGIDFIKSTDGSLSPIGAPAGVRSTISGAQNLPTKGNAKTLASSLGMTEEELGQLYGVVGVQQPEQFAGTSIEATRNLIRNISKTIKSQAYLPGVDTRVKLEVLSAVKQALDDAVAQVPELQSLLGKGNQLYSQNIDRFKSSFSKGILSDLGVEGGASPEAIMRKLTGPDAESNLQQFSELLGAGATAGDDLSNKGLGLVREAVLSKARTAGESATGAVSVGKMFDVVDSLPQPVRDRLFPGFTRARDLVVREAALKTAGKTTRDAELLLNQVRVDPTDLKTAFEGDYRDLVGAAKKAVGVAEARSKLLSNLGLDDLSKRSAFDIKDWMTDPSNQSRLKNTITQLQKKAPQLVDDAKGLLMDDIIGQSTSRGVFDPDKFLSLVQKSQLPTGPGAPGVPQGKYAEAIETVFGKARADEIKNVAATLTDIRRPGDSVPADKKGIINYIVLGYTGGPIASTSPATVLSAIGRIIAAKEPIKYSIASKFLTDDALRKEAMKPIGEGTVKALDRAVRLTAASIADQFGKNSPEYDEITAIDRSIQPGATRYTPPSTTASVQRPAPVEQPRQQPASIEVPMPNRNGRLVNKVMTREEAMKKLEETRAQMQRLRQQLND